MAQNDYERITRLRSATGQAPLLPHKSATITPVEVKTTIEFHGISSGIHRLNEAARNLAESKKAVSTSEVWSDDFKTSKLQELEDVGRNEIGARVQALFGGLGDGGELSGDGIIQRKEAELQSDVQKAYEAHQEPYSPAEMSNARAELESKMALFADLDAFRRWYDDAIERGSDPALTRAAQRFGGAFLAEKFRRAPNLNSTLKRLERDNQQASEPMVVGSLNEKLSELERLKRLAANQLDLAVSILKEPGQHLDARRSVLGQANYYQAIQAYVYPGRRGPNLQRGGATVFG